MARFQIGDTVRRTGGLYKGYEMIVTQVNANDDTIEGTVLPGSPQDALNGNSVKRFS